MRRLIAISLCGTAAALLLVGGLTVGWWSQSSEGVTSSIGLREARVCTGDACMQAGIDRLEPSAAWLRTGAASYAAALLTAGLLLIVVVFLAVRRPSTLVAGTCLVAAASALVAGLAFVWTTPDYPAMRAGYSMIAYFTGALLGVAGAFTARRTFLAQLPLAG